nr:M48 family metalloprotease [Brevundimonas denitrificans]
MQPFLVSMALGALAIAAGAPDAGAALLGSSGYFGTIGALQYMQSQEGEADLTGAQALDRAGLSARGLVEFFEEFRAQEVFPTPAAIPISAATRCRRDGSRTCVDRSRTCPTMTPSSRSTGPVSTP